MICDIVRNEKRKSYIPSEFKVANQDSEWNEEEQPQVEMIINKLSTDTKARLFLLGGNIYIRFVIEDAVYQLFKSGGVITILKLSPDNYELDQYSNRQIVDELLKRGHKIDTYRNHFKYFYLMKEPLQNQLENYSDSDLLSILYSRDAL